VIHFAALKSVGESMTQPHRYFDWNIGGTVSLVRAIMESGVSKLVFSSSASVYGSAAKIPMDESLPIAPESVYASTKAASESLLFWCSSLGLESVSLRYFNAAGASSDCTIGEDWTTTHNLIPRLMRAMITQQEPLALFGTDYPTFDGTCIRDFIHVEDLAEAHLAALDYLGRGGRVH
jgi:UDP-glucose 4-epimerase